MRLRKKGLTAAVLLAVMAVTLTACDGLGEKKTAEKGEDDKTKLTVITWNYNATPEFEESSRAFEAEDPDITIKSVDIASDDHDTRVTTMFSSGDTTNILTTKNLPSYSDYALRSRLVGLTDHVRDLDIELVKAGYEIYEIDGKTYARSYCTDFWVLYYSKKMLDEAGIAYPDNLTWDEYEALMKKLFKPEE